MQHCFGKQGLLAVSHAVQKHGHQPRGDLIFGDVTAGDPFDEERDLIARQFRAVTFFADDVLRSQLFAMRSVSR